MKSRYIGISGTHGTGKTSLLWRLGSKLIEKGENVSMIEEGARLSPLPINSKGTLDTQLWMIGYQLNQEATRLGKTSWVLSDRTIVDLIAYGEYTLEATNPKDAWILNKMKLGLVEIVRRNYDLILVPDIELFDFHINDGVRDMNKSFREDIYHRILDIYSSANISVKLLKTTDIDEIFNYFY